MAQAQTKTKPGGGVKAVAPKPTAAKTRSDVSARVAQRPAPVEAPAGAGEEVVLNVPRLKAIGEAMFGVHWQQDLANATHYDKGLITRVMSGSRSMPQEMPARLRRAVVARMQAMADVLAMEGVPERESMRTTRAIETVRHGAEIAEASPEMLASLMVASRTKTRAADWRKGVTKPAPRTKAEPKAKVTA